MNDLILTSKHPSSSFFFSFLLLLTLFFPVQTTLAQDTPLTPARKGAITITPYFGFPNLLTAALQNTYELTNQKKEQLRITGIGPIGVRAGYFITDHLAVGGEVSYASTTIQWKESGTLQLNDSTAVPYTYSFRLKAPRIRTLLRLNYHFAITQHHDWYAGLGIGFNNTRIKLDTNAPYIRDYDILSLYFLPVSTRLNFGFNYYLKKNIGLNMEVGLGGPLASVGIIAAF